MNAILSMILSWQFIFLSLSIAVVAFVIRTVVDVLIMDNPNLPGTRNSRIWRSLILPLLPISLGVGFAFLSHKYAYTFPDGVATQTAQFLFCTSAGALSGVMFKVVRELLLSNVALPPIFSGLTPNVVTTTTTPNATTTTTIPVTPDPTSTTTNINTGPVFEVGHGINSTSATSTIATTPPGLEVGRGIDPNEPTI